MNLFDLSLQINGFPIKKAEQILKEVQAIPEANYKSYIESKKDEIVQFHTKNNSFYQNFINNRCLDTWESIPVMTKRDLQTPLNKRLSTGYTLKNVYTNKTSGSSGAPFSFAKDYGCHALTWAVIKNRFGWYGLDFNSSKQARFYGIPLDKKNYYKERFKDFLSFRYRFSVFDLTDKAFKNHLIKFRATPFKYLNGYTSSMVQFAKFLNRKKLVLSTICPTLKVCVVTSEMLFDADKKLLEEQFGVPVVNEYGASELDLIAFQNPTNQWQINSETLFVEILDDNNHVLPKGESGRIVITSLYNKAHPFIRYDIGDIGCLDESGSLKKPILKKLIGRTNDLAILPSGKKAAGLTFYYVTKSIIEDDNTVKEFVIHQLKLNTFKIIYASSYELSETKKTEIKKAITTYLEPNLVVIFERQDVLKRSKSGKLKQFSSFIKQH
ncbi:phenylacetate--CoA ligase family protein [Bizionia sp. KMM 8389]